LVLIYHLTPYASSKKLRFFAVLMIKKTYKVQTKKRPTSQAGSVDNFGMNIDKDILNAVTGLSNDSSLGKQISGSVEF